MKTTLLIMAAGIGSRFGTGIKQLEPVDDANHIIMDYSIHDAIKAGFNHVVFIIRKDIEKEFKEVIGDRIASMVSDQKPDLLPSIVVQSDGKFMTTTSSGFDNATVRKVRELLHHEKFLENGTAERARESGTEQNYNMIDGCVNNVPKKPRVIGGRVSVLDRLHIKQAERARKDNAQVQQQERTRKT